MQLRSHEDFEKRLKKVFPELKLVSKYLHNKTPIIVESEFGLHKIIPNSLLQGKGAHVRNALNQTNYSIRRFKKIWGERYDYSKFEYVGTKKKSTITCRIHGDFNIVPNDHLANKGCVECGKELVFLAIKSCTEDFVKKAKKIHGDRYDYSKVDYTSARSKVEIICKEHGVFMQSPNTHLNKSGCPVCGNLGAHGFKRKGFIEASKNRPCMLYLLKCNYKGEEFFKVGITSVKLTSRYSHEISAKTLEYDILYTYEDTAGNVWDAEKKLIKNYYKFKYLADKSFNGYTECFNLSLPVEEIINELEKLKNENTKEEEKENT
jgi:hypothetical protein